MEEPPKDFFCAVSLELLREPRQTDCCGHHFEREVAEQLQKSGKPCPMCKKVNFTTHEDKYHKRRVSEVSVRCLHKKRGCGWVGELGNLEDHVTHCPKQPWQCQYCSTEGLKEMKTEHLSACAQFPVPCPNSCLVGTVPRCQVDQHKLECPLEELDCEYAEFGCTVRLPRRDMGEHLRQGEQQHVLKMCVLNIGLSRKLMQEVAEKDQQIGQLQAQVQAMEKQLHEEVEKLQEATVERINAMETRLHTEVKGMEKQLGKSVSQANNSVEAVKSDIVDVQHQVYSISSPIPPLEFVVTNFAALKYHKQEWRCPPFYSHHGGYKMCIGVAPSGSHSGSGTHVSIRFYKMRDLNSAKLTWGIKLRVTIQVLNQATLKWEREYIDEAVRSEPQRSCEGSSACYHYLPHSGLGSYVRNDQFQIRVADFKVLQ